MANTSLTREYTDFVTATVDRFGHKMWEDNISRASPILAWLMDDGSVTMRGSSITGAVNGSRYLSGLSGDKIREPLMTELNSTPKWYAGTETFDTTEQNVGTAAFFDPKQLGCTITISGRERRGNKGKEAQLNLLKGKSDQAMISLRNKLAIAMFSDGTGSNGKEVYGLTAIAPADGGAAVAYGEITANTSWWLSQRSRTQTGTAGDIGDFNTNFRDYGKRLFNDCTEGSLHPDIHVVTQGLEEAYDNTLKGFERHTSKKMLDLGYDNILTYMGQPVVWDRKHPDHNATSMRWFMFTSEMIALRYEPDANFSVAGFQRPVDGDFISSPVIWEGAVCTNCRRVHGVGTGITV